MRLREAAHGDANNTPEPKSNNSTNLESEKTSQPCEPSDAVILESSTRHEDSGPRNQSINHATRPNHRVIQRRPITSIAPPKKMEFSQQTPTQVNDDRDYSEYTDLIPSSPVNGTTQNTSHEPGTLDTDDTGAVNFGILSELARPSSQVSEDVGFENTRGDWRLPDGTSQNHSSNAYTPYRPQGAAFETPAVPKNPFATKSTAVPLAGSQLFGQTQFSSAIKKISPTSSRPSPNLFHHSMSPNVYETSPLKNRANVSSPTDIRTSSPQRLHDVPDTSSREKDGDLGDAETPRNSRSTGGDIIPESPPSSDTTPRAPPPRSSGNYGPLAHYEPMKKSQERKTSDELLIAPMGDDSDSDDPIRRIERRKRIQRKRAKAAEEMERVSFTPKIKRDSSEPVRKRRRLVTEEAPVVAERPDLSQTESGESAPLVGDSQNRLVPSNETLPDTLPVESTKATPGDDMTELEPMDQEGDIVIETVTEKMIIEEEMIPATSPAGSSLPPTAPPEMPPTLEPELPTLVVEPAEVRSSPPRELEDSSSLPLARRRSMRTYGRGARTRRRNPFISSSDAPTGEELGDSKAASSPVKKTSNSVSRRLQSIKTVFEVASELGVHDEVPPAATISPPQSSKPELPPPMTTRSRGRESNPITPLAARSVAPIPPTSSSLSILSQTPVPSAKTTPGTQNSPGSERPESVNLPSPKDTRRRSLRAATKSESPQPTTRASRMAKRSHRLDSESTDELHYSPSASALEKSIIQSRSGRSFRQSLGPTYRACRLFEGMVFAISFQNQGKPHERNKLETKITHAGGTILSEGFQEMFEHSAVMDTSNPTFDEEDALKLNKANLESGFTALIADSHSRKAKYMQALALGIPCLAPQWITTCLNKGAIVDWEPYVLCAGASTVLGNAIRSRNLIPYLAVEARFIDIIDQRTRLLDGQRVLVVVDSKKARSEAKQPYIFLATILGPSITRVFTVEQARETLHAHQKAGTPFDWLYIDKLTGKADAVLAPVGGTRRRKSTQTAVSSSVRVLDDELVIQSLILGRMVEEDEMDF